MFRWRNTRPADRPGEGGEAPEGEMLALIYLRPVRVSRAPGLVLSVVLAVFWATQARSAAGDLDPTFGQGIVTTSFGGQAEVAQAMAIQSDGKLVLVGGTQLGLNPGIPDHFAVARYNVDGTLDPGFGTGGKATTAV